MRKLRLWFVVLLVGISVFEGKVSPAMIGAVKNTIEFVNNK